MSLVATVPLSESPAAKELTAAVSDLTGARNAVREIIYGQDAVIDLTLTALLSGGHTLLVGMPGVAKTLLVSTLATVMGLSSKRVQCTPDLMPSDILGSEILDESASGKREFRFLHGPVFCQLLMADEINRASPRTQSALLQAMQEHQVTVAGVEYKLPEPFLVLATQNPIEHEGTYPLPEAQLDRFLMQVDVPYPDREAEKTLLLRTTGAKIPAPKAVLTSDRLLVLQQLVRRLPIGDAVVEGILSLLRACRPEADARLTWGPGPRAGQALMLAARARALLDGRPAPSLDDVKALATPVLTHRMALSYAAAAEGATPASVIADACRCLS